MNLLFKFIMIFFMAQTNADLIDAFIKIASFLGAGYVCWQLPTAIFKRLVIISNRQMALKGMFEAISGRVTDIEGVLGKKIGYKPASTTQKIEDAFSEQFKSDDTGF